MSTPDYLPSPDDLATLLRARTKDANGTELGKWSDETRPTETDVARLIALAASELVPVDFTGPCTRSARSAIAYHAACLIELSYFPEQVRSDRSPYEELKVLADAARAELDVCISSGAPDSGGGAGGEGYAYHSLNIDSETTARYYEGGGEGWRHPERPATWVAPCTPPSPAQPALIDEPEPPPEPITPVVIGYPSEGVPELGYPPVITRGSQPPPAGPPLRNR
jgi:hypothetical protein